MPMAVCNVLFGRKVALRHNEAPRVTKAITVRIKAACTSGCVSSGAMKPAYTAARVVPEAHPSMMKFTSVSGCDHSFSTLIAT